MLSGLLRRSLRCHFFVMSFITSLFIVSNSHAAIVINEFMASNDSVLLDEDGEASDWIELHNDGASAESLNGLYLTDDEDELDLWQIPNVDLAADSYLIIFASDNDRNDPNSELHTNFKLGSGGEYLALIDTDGSTVISEYSPEYPEQFEDISYGPGGYYLDPTPGTQNNSSVEGFAEPVEFDLEHGFYDSPQTLGISSSLSGPTIRYTLDGSLPPSDLSCEAPADGNAWSYDYYEETSITSMPDFAALTPVLSGTTNTISSEVGPADNNFALQFTGCIEALADGFYAFETESNDGSQLHVDGALIVDNDNSGSTTVESGEVYLSKGLHEVTVSYYQNTGNSSLLVEWSAPLRGQTAVLTQNDGQLYAANANSSNVIEFEFDLPSDGTFNLNARVQGLTGSSSFWVQLNDEALWQFEFGSQANLQSVAINDSNVTQTPTLTAGEHTLKFFPREDGAAIDSITISGAACDGPCETQTLEAEIQDVSGLFIYAGLDSEELPGEKWFTYSSPITIDKTSIVRAIATQQGFIAGRVATQTYLFLDDIILQSPNEEVPEYWIDVSESVEQDLDYGMDPDIVGPDSDAVKTSLASLPSISVVTEIENLLHPDFGIYVNALEKGRFWERPASIELIDGTNNEAGFTIDAGIRIRGGFSRNSNNPRHPFRVYFRNDYDGDLDYPLFGDQGTDEFERIDFRAPNNYSWAFQGAGANGARNTLLREIWSRDTQAAIDRPHTRSRYYHLYLNGQYWGIHMTQERVTDDFAKSYFGGSKSDYDIVKHNRQDDFQFEANDGTTAAWVGIWNIIQDEEVSAADYVALDAQVDLDNLIDFFLINGYEGDLDGPTSWFIRDNSSSPRWTRANNWYAARDRVGDTLKWSFFQHDGEHTLGAAPNSESMTAAQNTLGPFAPFNNEDNSRFSRDYMNPYWLHAALSTNSDYRQRAIDRSAQLFAAGGALSTEQALARWNIREGQIADAMLAQSARWGDSKRPDNPRTLGDWQAEVSNVENNFFPGRSETVFAQLVALGLASDIELPTLSIPSETEVAQGTVVTITNNSTGTIYYTTDGSDPRESGGGISANAIELLGDEIIIDSNIALIFRVRLPDGSWSALVQAEYTVPVSEDTCYVVPAKNGNTVVFCL